MRGAADRVRDVHAVIDHVDDDLQHGGDDAAAAGRSGDRYGLPSFSTMVGVIDDSGRLRGAGALAVAADQAEGIGHAGLGGEIVELVVEQDAGAFGDQPDAVAEIERVGVGRPRCRSGRPRKNAWCCRLRPRAGSPLRISADGVARSPMIVARMVRA